MGRREAFFEQAAEAADRAVLAITQDQEAHTRSAVDELRFLRSLITTGEPHQASPDELVDPTVASLQCMRLALEAVRESDEVIQAWHQQNLALVARDGSSLDALAWQRLMDHALPAAWNFEADLLVVHGAPEPGLLDALRERGQRRVVVIAPTPETALQAQGLECFVGDDTATLSAFTAGLSKPYPKTCAEMCGSWVRICSPPPQPKSLPLQLVAKLFTWFVAPPPSSRSSRQQRCPTRCPRAMS